MDKRDIIGFTQHGRDVCNHQAIELLRVCNLFVASTRRASEAGDPAAAFPYLCFRRELEHSPEFCMVGMDLETAERSIRETIDHLAALAGELRRVRQAVEQIREQEKGGG